MKKLILIISMLLVCIAATAQKGVTVIYDTSFDFEKLSSFAYSESTLLLAKKFNNSGFFGITLSNQLGEKGIKHADDPESADVIVNVKLSYDESVKVTTEPHTVYGRYYAAPRAGRGIYRTSGTVYTKSVSKEKTAQLVISIIDKDSRQEIWTGVWFGEPNPDMPLDKRMNKVEKVLKKMFKTYPD